MKVVFMGTPDFAVETLKAIAGAGHDIAAVVTQPDKPRGRSGALMFSAVKEEAVNLGIECILQPEKARDEAFIQQIRDINPDVIVVVAYGKILPKSLLDIPKYGCINVHASLLPKYRGAAPIQWSVINGDEYSGVTTMFMGEGLDTGDILLQKSIKLDKKETGGSLFDKLSVIGAELLVETLVELKNGTVKRIPQDESQATQVTVFDMTGKSVGEMTLSDAIFGIEPNTSVMHAAVVNYLANQRQGTQSTLTRSEVSGGGRKPWKQKGTGRARQGSTRAPQWTHGGIALGPKPRDYSYELPKKVKRLALKSAFSTKVADNDLIVVDNIAVEGFKTKAVVEMLSKLGADKKALIVMPELDQKLIKSAANIPGVKTALVNTINVYDILNCDKFIVAKGALEKIEEVYA